MRLLWLLLILASVACATGNDTSRSTKQNCHCDAVEDSLRRHLLLVSYMTAGTLTHQIASFEDEFGVQPARAYYDQLNDWLVEQRAPVATCLEQREDGPDSLRALFDVLPAFQIMSTLPSVIWYTRRDLRERYQVLLRMPEWTLNECRDVLDVRSR
jgi:hypothetical protein